MPAEHTSSRLLQYPKTTCTLLVIGLCGLAVGLVEYALGKYMGLGNPVVYEANLLYGYRPAPNQYLTRFHGAEIKINNLGLRADADWNSHIDDKILFLGDSITYGGSYISNDELFSTLAVKGIVGYQAGNSGVNGWGVENIYGLIVQDEFLPAQVYVTTLIEDDFYRGLVRLAGQPYWSRKPTFALEELLYWFYYLQHLKRFKGRSPSEKEKHITAENGVRRLKEMDEFLKGKGFLHLIFISAPKLQVLKRQSKDPLVQGLLQKYGLDVVYILDKLELLPLPDGEKAALFHDVYHLERPGHALWATQIHDELVSRLR